MEQSKEDDARPGDSEKDLRPERTCEEPGRHHVHGADHSRTLGS